MENRDRTYNSTKNMLFGFMNKFLSMFLSFIGRAIFVRILAQEYLGINGLFSDILIMLSLADLGFGTAMAYSFYRPLAEDNKLEISALITFYKKIYNYIAFIVAVLGIAIVPFLDFIINTDSPIPNLRIYYLVSLVNTVISYLFVYKSSIITADQKSYEISKYSIRINIVKIIAQTGILYITHSYLSYISIGILTTIANNLIISYKANKMYPYIKDKVELQQSKKKEIFNNMKSVFLYKASNVLLTGTDNILISILVGTVFVGKYANYNMLTINLSSMAGILFGSLTASLGNLIIKENPKKRYEIFKVMQMVSFWLCGVFVICVYFLTEDFIVLWVGRNYLLNHLSLIAIVLNFYLALSLQPIWSYREATGLYMKTKYIMILTAGINIVVSIVLGNVFGVTGILGATFISKVSTYFWFEPNILFRDFFQRKVLGYYMGHIKNIAITLAAGIIVAWSIPIFLVNSYGEWILKACLCFGIVNIIYLLRYYSTKEFKMICGKIKYMLHVF